MIKKFLLAFLFLWTSSAFADSVSTAVGIVEEFSKEYNSVLKDIKEDEAVKSRKSSLEKKEQAVSDLKSLGWVEEPGARRFNQVRGIVDVYTSSVIASVRNLKAKLPSYKNRFDDGEKKLLAMKIDVMKKLQESFKAETYQKKRREDVPLSSPFETNTNEPQKMWER